VGGPRKEVRRTDRGESKLTLNRKGGYEEGKEAGVDLIKVFIPEFRTHRPLKSP